MNLFQESYSEFTEYPLQFFFFFFFNCNVPKSSLLFQNLMSPKSDSLALYPPPLSFLVFIFLLCLFFLSYAVLLAAQHLLLTQGSCTGKELCQLGFQGFQELDYSTSPCHKLGCQMLLEQEKPLPTHQFGVPDLWSVRPSLTSFCSALFRHG